MELNELCAVCSKLYFDYDLLYLLSLCAEGFNPSLYKQLPLYAHFPLYIFLFSTPIFDIFLCSIFPSIAPMKHRINAKINSWKKKLLFCKENFKRMLHVFGNKKKVCKLQCITNIFWFSDMLKPFSYRLSTFRIQKSSLSISHWVRLSLDFKVFVNWLIIVPWFWFTISILYSIFL